MKKFLLLGSTQGVVNVLLCCWFLVGLIGGFVVDSSGPEGVMWLPVSALVALIIYLVYNVWVSTALNE
jgi:hypothetical protein